MAASYLGRIVAYRDSLDSLIFSVASLNRRNPFVHRFTNRLLYDLDFLFSTLLGFDEREFSSDEFDSYRFKFSDIEKRYHAMIKNSPSITLPDNHGLEPIVV